MSDTDGPEPDELLEDKVDTQPIPLQDAPFTPEELRQIKISVAAQLEYQKLATPVEVIVPEQHEPSFKGTYNRRPHWIAAVVSNVLAPILFLGTWILAFFAGAFVLSALKSIPGFDSFISSTLNRLPRLAELMSSTTYEEWISLWIPLIVSLAASLFIFWGAAPSFLEWFYEKRTVTETQVVLSRNVPGFLRNILFKIDDFAEKIDRKDVRNVKIESTGIGEFLGYATVTFETWSQTDTTFHKIGYFSHPNEIRTLFPIDDLGRPDAS